MEDKQASAAAGLALWQRLFIYAVPLRLQFCELECSYTVGSWLPGPTSEASSSLWVLSG